MSQNNTDAMTDERTETKTHTQSVSGDNLIPGDKIAARLVAPNMSLYGQRIHPAAPESDDEPKTQLFCGTATDSYRDSNSAILVDPETKTLIRATKINTDWAIQKPPEWTVKAVGDRVAVENGTVHDWGDEERVNDETSWVEGWAEVTFHELAQQNQVAADGRQLNGTSLFLKNDWLGIEATAEITLED
jgi:hypothetical protein